MFTGKKHSRKIVIDVQKSDIDDSGKQHWIFKKGIALFY